ncbi:hypothetical protein [Longimicrobium sp.]|uniref:hypothetical protein n=1 Tax=Longimicrobium sp. TaxID=2029185 RepID=UPI002C018DEC|nr:hypothetical protein [Longimicrobium sp.]HSU15961.1 hypothetical protein [Longimicrobium sp.]
MKGPAVVIALALAAAPAVAAAQQDTASTRIQGQIRPVAPPPPGQPRVVSAPAQQGGTPGYDVILEVPDLSVDSIGLTVQNLRAHLALAANAANLVTLDAGADVSIDRVRLEIVGVEAQAFLYVDLDNVTRIVNRVVATLDRNPRILTQVLNVVDNTVGTVGGVANTALAPNGVVSRTVGVAGQTLNNVTAPGGLLSQTVNTAGQTVQRVLQNGGIVERTLNAAGGVVSSRTVTNLLSLPVLQQTTNTAGQVVRQVRDQSGAVIELVLNRAGQVASSRVLSAAVPQR